jgi:anti-sigma regulatory factor (Ser/Thr protein kinase)
LFGYKHIRGIHIDGVCIDEQEGLKLVSNNEGKDEEVNVICRLTLEADMRSLAKLMESSMKLGMGPIGSKGRMIEYLLCIDEIFMNSITHGYRNQGGKIDVKYILNDNYLIIRIRDYGKGISKSLEDGNIELNENLLTERGRGLFIVKNLCDKLSVKSHGDLGTEVSIYFKRGDST